MTNREVLDYYLRVIRVNSIWIDMFLSGRFNTKDKWRDEMRKRLLKEGLK